ncbi:MAG: glycosyltransferase family 2 protein [Candidatus Falkowbacteria bacterium]|nr:glycosyltransferase family 2 protein [Candidatus Falkowbacteria bacterium]
MKIVCVIPAYNEAERIVTVINKVKPLVDELIVVDDNSRDETYRLATATGVTVLQHLINLDQGGALQTGTNYALKTGADIIVHFDADDQFAAAEIKDVIAPIISGEAEVVFGSRFLGKKSNLPWAKRHLIIPVARLVNRLLGINLTDPQSGFRALSRQAAEVIKITNNGKAHCSEYIAEAFRNKLKIKEVPITVTYHEFGQNFSGGLRIIKDLIIQKIIK